ncbi:MAG: metallopeptidase TldD-related protein [Defluviitaleaceae bacterium]|nr:metallopeptidase TldD-related protein [Defluviitaleaceae bacterium]MCL2275460.1 metallopeptidase TldD-related protein [Defluviitaleaceae bacterium]
MLQLLQQTLAQFEGVEYLIRETKTHRLECYNIKKQPEMKREAQTTDITLVLYTVFEEKAPDGEMKKYRGSFSTEIHPATGEDALKKIIEEGVYAAGFVKNAYYPLVSPSDGSAPTVKPQNMPQVLNDLQAAFNATDIHQEGHVSYSEFFITKTDRRILNSNGVDVSYTTYNAFIETAVHWKREGGEIEVGEAFRFSLDMENPAAFLKSRMEKLFTASRNKALAQPTPGVGDINILISGEALSTFFFYYKNRASTQMVYQQLSTYKEGDQIQSGDGDKITLTLDPLMQGSQNSAPYDDFGFPLTRHEIVKDGKLTKLWGDVRFSHYLNIPPTGVLPNLHVTGGTTTVEALRSAPYLELVSFSDFQADTITGDFGSEIRLGYYFDGEKTIPVTGGSISGNMEKVHGSLKMTKTEEQHGGFLCPEMICIRGASISGVV